MFHLMKYIPFVLLQYMMEDLRLLPGLHKSQTLTLSCLVNVGVMQATLHLLLPLTGLYLVSSAMGIHKAVYK